MTANKIVARIALPDGNTADNRRAFPNPAAHTAVDLVEIVGDDNGAQVPRTTELGELPLGTKELYIQHRMCGDYYCFIEGKKQVAAVGDTRADAFKNALKIAA